MNKQLSNCIDRHRTACEMAAKTRNLPRLVMWFSHEYIGEFPSSCDDEETLSKALLQFYPVAATTPRRRACK